ncbi:MAG: diguanylate cyclase [Bdellovibrionota bacterium]
MGKIKFNLNGKAVVTEFENGTHALDLLKNCGDRNAIKSPCSPLGSCGGCTILVNGHPTLACLSRPRDLLNKDIETLGDCSEACFILYNGQHLGRRFLMEKPQFTIGRQERCDLILDSACVSRRHAQILRSDSREFTIIDLGSTNGTFVNFEKIKKKRVLKNGDMIRLGTMLIKFYENNNIESAIHDRMYRLATFDELTQTYNRKFLMEKLAFEYKKASAQKSKLSIVFMDLDNFKKVNDTYGHQAGDFVLKETAQLIKSNIRDFDILGRYGGEELVLLLPGVEGKLAIAVAERIRKAVEAHQYQLKVESLQGTIEIIENICHRQTVSIGISSVSKTTASVKMLLDEADKRLYFSKASGRNKTTGEYNKVKLLKAVN